MGLDLAVTVIRPGVQWDQVPSSVKSQYSNLISMRGQAIDAGNIDLGRQYADQANEILEPYREKKEKVTSSSGGSPNATTTANTTGKTGVEVSGTPQADIDLSDEIAKAEAELAELEAAGEMSASDYGHAALDGLGMVPVVGALFDGINGLWYAAKGDYANAAMSGAALVPGAGQGATAAKYAAKAAKTADRLAEIAKIKKKISQLRAAAKKGRKGRPEKRVNGKKKKDDNQSSCKPCVGNPTLLPSGVPQKVDASFFVPGLIPIVLSSTYLGNRRSSGPLGTGRSGSVDAVLETTDDGKLRLTDGGINQVLFDRPAPNPEHWEEGDNVRPLFLKAGRKRSYILREEGRFAHFRKFPDGKWRITREEDQNGNALQYDRDADGVLKSIINPEGLIVHFHYNESGLRVRVSLTNPEGEGRDVLHYAYDTAGNMTLSDCPFGDRIEYGYDDHGNLVYHSRNGTYKARHDFDKKGRVTAYHTSNVYDGAHFDYDDENRIVTFWPGGDADVFAKYYYDTRENVTLVATPYGALARTVRNSEGRIEKRIDAEGNEISYTYDVDGNIKSITDGEGRKTFYAWDEDGNLEIVIDPEGNSWDYHYDEKGNLTAVEDANRYRTDITNNDRGQPIGVMRHDGLMRQNVYDENHRLSGAMDFNGAKTFYERDAFGRIVQITDALGSITQFQYSDQPGWDFWTPSAITRPDGASTSYIAKDRGIVTVDEGEGRKTTYRYDAFGNLLQITDAAGKSLVFHYDGQERLEKVTNQNGLDWVFERDVAGRIVREVDFDGQEFAFAYDNADRLVETRRSDGGRTTYAYDKSGLLIEESVWQPAATEPDKVTFAYNGRGFLEKVENAHSVVEFEYDANGQVIAESTNGHRIESDYDCCGLRSERRVFALERLPEPEGMEGLAEGLRALAEMRGEGPTSLLGDPLQKTNYAYDPLGGLRELRLGGAIGIHAPLQFTRNLRGQETSRSSAAGFSLLQTYDRLGMLSTQSAGRALVDDAAKREVGRVSPSKTVERSFGWNRFLEPVRVEDKRWGGSSYSYDKRGQVRESRFGDGYSERFSYDPAQNIEAVNEHGAARENDDRTGAPAGGTTVKVQDHRSKGTGDASPLERVLNWKSSKGGRAEEAWGAKGERILLTYDGLGRVIKRRIERNGFRPKEWRFEWDGRDRLTVAHTPDGAKWSYLYDPLGRRLSKTQLVRSLNDNGEPEGWQNIKISSFLWDGDVPVWEEEKGSSGTKRVEWHFEPETFVPIARLEGNQLCYVVTDHLGTPRELLSEDGQAVWAADYSTWGLIRRLWQADNQNELGPQGPFQGYDTEGNPVYTTRVMGTGLPPVSGNLALKAAETPDPEFCPIRFQGQWADAETGLYYNRFRYYDPEAAQYLSPDPIGLEGGLRGHGYVTIPSIWIDPYGLGPLLPGEGKVGTYRDLVKAGRPGDNLTPHHMPSDGFMKQQGVSRSDGISMNVEQPHPGKGGRHRKTRSYGKTTKDCCGSETPREALARDIKDMRQIYQNEGVYTPEIRGSLQEVIRRNKTQFPGIFRK